MEEPKSDTRLPAGPTGLLLGFHAVVTGTRRILTDPALRKLAIVPILVTLIAYIALFGASVVYLDDLLALLWERPEGGWLVVAWYAAWVASVIAAVFVMFLLFATLVEAIGGPFYDKMAAHVLEGHGIATREPGLIAGTVPDLFRSLFLLSLTIVFSVLGFIPVVGLPFSFVAMVLVWFSLAMSAINPMLLVTGHSLGGRLRFARRSLGTTLGVGATISFSLLIPLFGLISIPGGLVGATELYAKRLKA